MGFFSIATEVILQEHKYRPITGRVLMIGRQNTGMTPRQARRMIERNGIPLLGGEFETDALTRHWTEGQGSEITDRSFFAAFTDAKIEAIDISDYEGAEIVHDLSAPIPEELRGQFDFIYDGSTIDNVFNVAAAMQNIHDLLRPGGRCVLFNWSNSFDTAYAMLSPDWFMDFFAYHEYEDARVLVVEVDERCGRIWDYDPLVRQSGQNGYQCSSITSRSTRATVCFAEKSDRAPRHGYPVQMHYRTEKEPYLSSAIRFSNSPRPAYDLSWHGIKTERPTISSVGTLALLADEDRQYDIRRRQAEDTERARQSEHVMRQASLIYRFRSAVADRRLISGLRHKLAATIAGS